ncbi:MAG: NADH-quinone oxidoreductase subunit NuoH [Alphaproteobacteria bacterium]|nr:NADH-quinone oxidoreductase subunit NuoH [Alphaproteobacteria bacterium]
METFIQQYLLPVLPIVLKIICYIVPLIVSVAYLTYAERRVIAFMQLRKGPNVVGPFGLLQPIADAVKLISKEMIIPTGANKVVFILAPMITFILAFIGWAVIPVSAGVVIADVNVGVLYLLAISSLGVYGIIMSGWASNSKYAFLGAIRSSAQMISYEVAIGFVMVTVLMTVGSLNLTDIVEARKTMPLEIKLLLFPMMVVFFICMLAETNRHPFDLPEAEAELVAGFNVEYSSMAFALFFLGEYANMILMSGIMTILFMGGWLPPLDLPILAAVPGIVWFAGKVAVLLFTFLWVRATFPRYRYDQLMRLGWKIFLPLTLIWVVIMSAVLVYGGYLPTT